MSPTLPDQMGLSWHIVCRPGKLILFIGLSDVAYPTCRCLEPVAIEPRYDQPALLREAARNILVRYSINPATCEIDLSLAWLAIKPETKNQTVPGVRPFADWLWQKP